jgi:branched-chain amino acid transport system substrate-binding protein
MLKRYKAFEPSIPTGQVAPHVSMGFNNMWVLLNDVLPRAIQKHGGFGADALAMAARGEKAPGKGGVRLARSIDEVRHAAAAMLGRTLVTKQTGVKFNPPGHPMAGQNGRALAAVFQVIDGEFKHVYPPVVASMPNPPVLLPGSSPFLAK